VRDIVENEDSDKMLSERIHLKLLRLCSQTQEGFVLNDFPNNVQEAEILEEYKGGINAFVHLSLPDDILIDIEENKITCESCDKDYYKDVIVHRER
jgi:adenylate kinase family enzyme